MKRRAVLASLGTLSVALAGCTDSTGTPGSGTDTTTTDPGPGTGTVTDTATPTPTPDGGTVDSRFAGEPCPGLGTNADSTVCWHTADPATARQYLEPEVELFEPSTGDGSVETVTFVLHNQSGGGIGFNPYAWSVHRQTDDGWEYVAPEMFPEPWFQLEDGQTYTWVFSVEEHPTPQADRTRYPMVDLEDGTYAFEITIAAEEGPNTGERVSCLALFEVQRA